MEELFPIEKTISDQDKYLFYEFKSEFLRKHGKEDGYDLQQLICRNCKGTNKHWNGEECFQCEQGIHKSVELRRFILNGEVFHEPINTVPFQRGYVSIIRGLIKHETNENQLFCYFILLAKYDRDKFFHTLSMYMRMFTKRRRDKFREAMHGNKLLEGLRKFLGIKDNEYDLPF